MVDPINYAGMLPQLDLRPLQGALAQRRENRTQEALVKRQEAVTQLAQDKFKYDQAQDQAYRDAVSTYQAAPSPEGLRDLQFRFPEQSERLTKAADSYDAGVKRDLVGTVSATLGAIQAGNRPLAIDTLKRRRAGLVNSNVDTSHTDAAIKMLDDGNDTGAKAYLSYALGGLIGGEQAAGVWDALGVGARAEDRRADNARADAALEARERRDARSDARADAREARADRREERADRREARIARGGSASSGDYEYRVDPATGAVQRRKRR